uniref:C-C motif chemokine n=1 Tax=Lepisosteus oculatus TaxID=7918 RepID=W5MIT7_LEPOC
MKHTLTIFLCFTAWTICIFASNGPSATCCLTTSNTKLRPQRIKNYSIQNGTVCPVNAVVFYTVKGKRVCSDPGLKWVKKAMEKLDQNKGSSRPKNGKKIRKGRKRCNKQN